MRRSRIPVEVTGPVVAVEVEGVAPAELLLANDDDLTFAKLRFDDRSLATLLAGGVSALAEPLARSLCWTALHDMARDAELSASAFVAAIVDQVARENDPALLERVLSLAVVTAERHSADTNRRGALASLAHLAASRLRESATPLIWARCLAATAGDDEHLTLLAHLMDGDADVPGLDVDDELRWALLARLCSTGRAGEAEVDAALRLDPGDAGQRRALSCLAAQPSADAKARAWAAAFEQAEPSRARLAASLGGFSTGLFAVGGFQADARGQVGITALYARRYFDALPALWEEREYEVARLVTESVFPHEPADEAAIEAVERVIDLTALPWSARRILMEGRDGLRRASRARAMDGGSG